MEPAREQQKEGSPGFTQLEPVAKALGNLLPRLQAVSVCVCRCVEALASVCVSVSLSLCVSVFLCANLCLSACVQMCLWACLSMCVYVS